jgi:hypothetical protein
MIVPVRTLPVLALLCGALALAAAGTARQSQGSPYSARDLPRIVDAKPVVPSWSFTTGDPYIYPIPKHAPAFTLEEWFGESPTPEQEALAAKLTKAGFLIGRHRRWAGENKQRRSGADAAVFALLFRDASGAHVGVRALHEGLKRTKWLGDESWTRGSSGGAVLLWRRGNLVALAELVCDTKCGFPAVPPARAYAGQIDARAKRAS